MWFLRYHLPRFSYPARHKSTHAHTLTAPTEAQRVFVFRQFTVRFSPPTTNDRRNICWILISVWATLFPHFDRIFYFSHSLSLSLIGSTPCHTATGNKDVFVISPLTTVYLVRARAHLFSWKMKRKKQKKRKKTSFTYKPAGPVNKTKLHFNATTHTHIMHSTTHLGWDGWVDLCFHSWIYDSSCLTRASVRPHTPPPPFCFLRRVNFHHHRYAMPTVLFVEQDGFVVSK